MGPAATIATQSTPETTDAALPTALASDLLPRDLSPWGMFMAADIVVKIVMGLLVGFTDQLANKTCTILMELTNACNLACSVS